MFDIIKSIYKKDKLKYDMNTGLSIVISKWLSYDTDNINVLQEIVDKMFYINPQHYYYLLYFSIPHKPRAPFLKKVKEEEKEEESRLYKKIKYILGWSNNELEKNKPLLKYLNKDYWKVELGIER